MASFSRSIGFRLNAKRSEMGIPSETICEYVPGLDMAGLNAIERGAVDPHPTMLSQIAKVLRVDVNYFTDPYCLIGEGDFIWLHDRMPSEMQVRLEDRIGRWIAFYREMVRLMAYHPSSGALLLRVDLPPNVSGGVCKLPGLLTSIVRRDSALPFSSAFIGAVEAGLAAGWIDLPRLSQLLNAKPASVQHLLESYRAIRPA